MSKTTREDSIHPEVKAFFDRSTHTASYVVIDPDGARCAVIDPVLDFDLSSGKRTKLGTTAEMIAWIRTERLAVDWILETHCHADHLSAAFELRERLGARVGIGRGINSVQRHLRRLLGLGQDFDRDGSQFDELFDDGAAVVVGRLVGRALATPGHTPACVTYVFGDAAFVGDALLMPDCGSGRADFPGGDARALYRSIRRILSLPPETRLFTCHDYAPRREYAWESTVAEQRERNLHANDRVTEAEFVALRSARDRRLRPPAMMQSALRFNLRGDGEGRQ